MNKVRGVNLGGWFVLERWMTSALFEGVEGRDETVFSLQKVDAEATLHKHWATFIKEDDFKWLKERNLNSVRIPVPWWLFNDAKPYFSCLAYLDQAMHWAQLYNLAVCLDLHTAPGCQNGFDNGGIEGVCTWHHKPENIELTLSILERIADRYKEHPAFWGIELLNEPRWDIDIEIIQQFYVEGYHRLRKIIKPQHTIVFHDAFRHEVWEAFFTHNSFENVALDVHLYQCFDDSFNRAGLMYNLRYPLEHQVMKITHISSFVRCIVGEWSLGLNPSLFEGMDHFNEHVAYRSYAANQLLAFEHGFGWYFWNYKIASDYSHWNFRKLVESQVLPNDYMV